MIYCLEKSKVEKLLNSYLEEIRGVKIKSVFSLIPGFWNHTESGHRIYMDDSEIFILLENGKCFVFRYFFVDECRVEFRELLAEEKERYENCLIKDYFNIVNNIHDHHTLKVVRR